MYERDGKTYSNISYTPRQFPIPHLEPYADQQNISTKIIEDFNERGYNVSLISGKPGIGKSMIPYFVARYLLNNEKCENITDVAFIDSFCPIQPGDGFYSLYTKTSPTENRPLIVVMEEIDIIISNIHTDNVPIHKYILIELANKTQWSQFFDKFAIRRFPHVIFIMTTNKPLSYFNELDTSYMRQNRVNTIFEV